MSQRFRKLFSMFSLVLIASMVLSACGGAATPEVTPTTGQTTGGEATATTGTSAGGTATDTPSLSTGGSGGGPAPTIKNPDNLVVGTTANTKSLDPAWAYDTASASVIFNVYDTLLAMNKDKTSEFVPDLATKWDVSQDGKTYTFTIRKGVKFHNGEDLTPEDVAYSLQRGLMQDRSGGPQWIMLQPFFGLDVQSFATDVVGRANGTKPTAGATPSLQTSPSLRSCSAGYHLR